MCYHSICKVHTILIINPIVGQYTLYVAQTVYMAHVTICRGLPNVKVPSTYLRMIYRIIVGFTYISTNILFGSFLCMSGIVLKGQQNRPKDILYLVLVDCGVVISIPCKGLRLILRSEIFNIKKSFYLISRVGLLLEIV